MLLATHDELGVQSIAFDAADRLLFTENETNFARLFGIGPRQGCFKDAFHEYVVHDRTDAVNSTGPGTKAAAFYLRAIPAGGSTTIRVRLCAGAQHRDAFLGFDEVFIQRIAEADAFYSSLQKDIADPDMRAGISRITSGWAMLPSMC